MNNVTACVINGTGSTSALVAARGCVRPQSGADAKRDTHLPAGNYKKESGWELKEGDIRWRCAAEGKY